MKTLLASVALLLTACGPARGEFTCDEAPGWTFENQPRCRSVAFNLRLARELLGDLPTTPVYVQAGGAQGDKELGGNYDARWGITLACDGLSYAHEVMHVRGDALTFLHSGWDENGNWYVDDTYKSTAVPLRCP